MNQQHFNFTKAKKAYEIKFYALPQILLQGERYKELSDSAILLYSVLRDRLSYSLQNHWVDEDDNVYFIFTNQELKELRHWSNDKTNKVKKELEDANLLLQKRMGFNPKTGKNEPNRLYLADLEVTATDIYQKHANEQENAGSLGTSGNPKIGNPQDTVGSLGTSGNPKIGNPQDTVDNTSQSLGTSGNPKIGHNQDKTNKPLDTNRYNIDTTSLDFSNKKYTAEQLEQQNQDLMTHAQEFLTDQANYPTFLNQESIDLLGKWCNTPKELHRFIGIILNARKDTEKEKQVHFFLDNDTYQQQMTNTIRRFFNAIRKDDHTIHTTTENYLYGTFKHLFADIAIDILNEQWQKEDERNEQAFLANIEQQLNNKQ
ncbi:replication initiator protein A [Tetragenococcus halophilus]|uniref:Replication initiator protein A n=1 Tax=Tetragenococcus halophilus TaxID=51669 RepID=A0AB35HRR1_TETHA|nr:replication initiator protein A [Tetragenococcus halophilus]MCO8296232.1 replication initiator protein A [Tetragenococcus halophilus]MCO8298785.1 replication initiator protein A [Tetragenococcus halophilus]